MVIGGPAKLKEKMVERIKLINTAPKVVRVINTQYDKKSGLYELLNQCTDFITSLQIDQDRYWIGKFMKSLEIDPGTGPRDNLAVYGNKNVIYALETGILDNLILHEDNNDETYQELCSKYGTNLIIITSFLPEAKQIKNGFGGIVGLLRYPITFDFFPN